MVFFIFTCELFTDSQFSMDYSYFAYLGSPVLDGSID